MGPNKKFTLPHRGFGLDFEDHRLGCLKSKCLCQLHWGMQENVEPFIPLFQHEICNIVNKKYKDPPFHNYSTS